MTCSGKDSYEEKDVEVSVCIFNKKIVLMVVKMKKKKKHMSHEAQPEMQLKQQQNETNPNDISQRIFFFFLVSAQANLIEN